MLMRLGFTGNSHPYGMVLVAFCGYKHIQKHIFLLFFTFIFLFKKERVGA